MKPKILCVDDEKDIQEALTRLLRQDFIVITAGSAEDGLKQIDQHPDISIVLTDYNLPGISGNDFLHLLKNKAPYAIRAMLSGQIDLFHMSEAINRSDIHRFILKPWSPDHLLIQMREALNSHNLLREKERLKVLSITDPLTGLTNHRYFQEQLLLLWEKHHQNQQPLTVCMIDIDHFKEVNDHHGHVAGDQILVQVAKRLMQNRAGGEILSRYGGEEFGLLLPNTPLSVGILKAEEIKTHIHSQPFLLFESDLSHPTLSITVSMGLATLSKENTYKNPTHLLAAADSALYQAKGQGRNRIISAPSTQDRKPGES